MAIGIRAACGDDAALLALLGRLTFRETFGALFQDHESELTDYLETTFSVRGFNSEMHSE